MSQQRKKQHRVQRDTNRKEATELKGTINKLKRQVSKLQRQLEKESIPIEPDDEDDTPDNVIEFPSNATPNKNVCPLCDSDDLGCYTTPLGKVLKACKKCKKWKSVVNS